MKATPFAVLLALAPLLGAATSLAAQDSDLTQRLRKFGRDLVALATAKPTEPSTEDLELVKTAKIDLGPFTPSDRASVLVILRFGATLRDEDLDATVEYGIGKSGRAITMPLQVLLALRGRMDDAARLTTAAMLDAPRDRRSYMTWKRWETFFGRRDDFFQLSHDFTLALLIRFEQGDEQEQQVVQDLLGMPDLTVKGVPEVRAKLEQNWTDSLARTRSEAEQKQKAAAEKVWFEDEKGPREVPLQTIGELDHWELRLQTGTEAPWGLLVNLDRGPEVVDAKLQLLRQLATSAHDEGKDLGEGRGRIAVAGRADGMSSLRFRLEALDAGIRSALAAAELLRVRLTFELPPDATLRDRGVEQAKALLAAVRAAARRCREASLDRTAADAAGDADAPILEQLRTTTATAVAWFHDLAAIVPPVRADTGWHDMQFTRGNRTVRTHIQITADAVQVVTVQSGTDHGASVDTLRREDLQHARFSTGPTGETKLLVELGRPVRYLFTQTPGRLVVARGNIVNIDCDTKAHRDELIAALKAFAAGKDR